MKIIESKYFYGFIGFLIGCFAFYPLGKAKAISKDAEEYLQIMHEVVSYLETDYVEKVDESDLYKGAIQGILASVKDPHTRFLNKDEFKELQSETRGSFGGLGIEVIFFEGKMIIVSPIDDTPASRAGLKPEDKIVEIDGKSTLGMSLSEAVGMMRGEVGSGLSLKIERNGSKPFSVDLVREMIKIQYIKTEFLPKEKLGYIRLLQFMGKETTAKEFETSIEEFRKQGAKGIIIDLRNNPGGLLDLSIQIAELFLEKDKEIVSVKGRGEKLIRTFRAGASSGKFLDIPIVVLMNNGSASASEILGGALKDQKRAKLLGTKSFGKGSVQNIYNLPHGTGVALTIQKYYTPSGISIHGKGIEPDILVEPITAKEDEKFYLEKLQKKSLLKDFVKIHPNYTEATSSQFIQELKKEKIEISDSLAKYLYYAESMIGKKPKLINPEFDPQLTEAIKILK
jgi:carboxyl-terminal processing protease